MPHHYYNLEEANAHVGELSALFARVLELRIRIKQRIPGEGRHKKPAKPEDRNAIHALMETLNDTTEEIATLGCVIKDLEMGLVDWPAWHEGREICLCWRFGESEVGFWHDTDAGYAGRRPVAELIGVLRLPAGGQDQVQTTVKSSGSGQS